MYKIQESSLNTIIYYDSQRGLVHAQLIFGNFKKLFPFFDNSINLFAFLSSTSIPFKAMPSLNIGLLISSFGYLSTLIL